MTIKEVSEKYDLTNDTLRYYEKVWLIGPIKKNKSGIRDYTEEDLKRIEFVKCMRSAGLSIEVLKEYIDLFAKGKKTEKERKELLKRERENLRKKIEKMQEAYDHLNYKIDVFYKDK